MIDQTVEWLSATGSPNGLLILALLTSPAVWAKEARKAVSKVFNRWFGADQK